MADPDPAWSLTDAALVLILHAENDITEKVPTERRLTGRRPAKLGGTITDQALRRETAVLRLISTVEAYANDASELYFTKKSLPSPSAPFSWPKRVDHYNKQHAIDLKACDGWEQVDAGIALRNCLAHGLGNLTQLLLAKQGLGNRMKHIDVSVGGGRMHTTMTTVPKLASGCRRFVLEVEAKLVALL